MEALGLSSLTVVVAQPPIRQSTKSVPIVRALLDNIVCLLSIDILNGTEFLVSTDPNNTLFVLYVSSPSQVSKIKTVSTYMEKAEIKQEELKQEIVKMVR